MNLQREYEVTVGISNFGFFSSGIKEVGKCYMKAKSKTEAQDKFYEGLAKHGLTGEAVVMNIEEVK